MSSALLTEFAGLSSKLIDSETTRLMSLFQIGDVSDKNGESCVCCDSPVALQRPSSVAE